MSLKSLKNFFIKFVSVVDSGDNPPAEVKMFKNKGGGNMKTFEELMKSLSEEDAKLIKTEVEGKDAKIAELDKTNKELEKNQKEPIKKEEPSDEELLKSADPKIRELLEKAQSDAKTAKEEADKLKKANDEKDAELKKELLNKEAEKYPSIGATKEDLIEILGSVDEKTSTLIKAIFSATNEALKDNKLMKAIGSDKDPEDKKAMEKVEDKVSELRKADPKLTKEQATTKVLKENPELYVDYLKE